MSRYQKVKTFLFVQIRKRREKKFNKIIHEWIWSFFLKGVYGCLPLIQIYCQTGMNIRYDV